MSLASEHAVPIPQAYWVLPGRLLAGEYPRDADDDTSVVKLQALHDAGITTFVDLTCDAHLKPYEALLSQVSKGRAKRHTFAIRDCDIPAEVGCMQGTLDAIDGALATGEVVYVHCWGGIGRTGTVVGCWLARHGHHGDAALERLAALWATCPKSAWHPESPQTEPQRHYVLQWPAAAREQSRMLDRAQGCLLGQLAGDALGSLVEFSTAASIRHDYPNGVRDMADGGYWNTIAGQPTDDSEMALALARVLVERGAYDSDSAREAYRQWYKSHPFDCGGTIGSAMRGVLSQESQANGALMRVSPLGIFSAPHSAREVASWARQDCALTHPHRACADANALFAAAIARAIATACSPQSLYASILLWCHEWDVDPVVRRVVERSATAPPEDYMSHAGWVLVALQNALWQMLHAPSLEEGIVDTIGRGGDTDTNAAISGALLGALHGRAAVPQRWVDTLLQCRPQEGRPGVAHPRPLAYWPVDVLELAEGLLGDEVFPLSN